MSRNMYAPKITAKSVVAATQKYLSKEEVTVVYTHHGSTLYMYARKGAEAKLAQLSKFLREVATVKVYTKEGVVVCDCSRTVVERSSRVVLGKRGTYYKVLVLKRKYTKEQWYSTTEAGRYIMWESTYDYCTRVGAAGGYKCMGESKKGETVCWH